MFCNDASSGSRWDSVLNDLFAGDGWEVCCQKKGFSKLPFETISWSITFLGQ